MADELILSIEKMIYGGEGLAHADGEHRVRAVRAPGRSGKGVRTHRKKKLIHANLMEVEKASPRALRLPARHFRVCGGCHYQHIEIAEQVRLKKEILRETLFRGSAACNGPAPFKNTPRNLTATATERNRRTATRCRGRSVISCRRARTSCRLRPVPRAFAASGRDFGQLQDLARANSLPPAILGGRGVC